MNIMFGIMIINIIILILMMLLLIMIITIVGTVVTTFSMSLLVCHPNLKDTGKQTSVENFLARFLFVILTSFFFPNMTMLVLKSVNLSNFSPCPVQ